jgi:hypothetical protein
MTQVPFGEHGEPGTHLWVREAHPAGVPACGSGRGGDPLMRAGVSPTKSKGPLASTASERGRLTRLLPGEGATPL